MCELRIRPCGHRWQIEMDYDGVSAAQLVAPPDNLPALAIDADAYGRRLGDVIFVDTVARLWQIARYTAETGDGVRVRLRPDDDLAGLGWECLHAPDAAGQWRPLGTEAGAPLSRVTAGAQPGRRLPLPPPLRAVAVLGDSPHLVGYGLPRLPAESVVTLLSALNGVCQFVVRAATRAELRQALAAGCDVLHILAHGVTSDAGTGIVVDGGQALDVLTAETILEMVLNARQSPGLIVLMACDSGRGAHHALGQLLARRGGAPAVISIDGAISLDSADIFSRLVYARLEAHGLIDVAVAEARAALREDGDWSAPVLHLRDENRLVRSPADSAESGGIHIIASAGGQISIGGHVVAGDLAVRP